MNFEIIYIAGDGRSGSTLLDSILANIPQSISVGECHRYWFRRSENKSLCSCQLKLDRCKLWSVVDEKLRQKFPNYQIDHFQHQVREVLKYRNFNGLHDLLQSEQGKEFGQVVTAFYQNIARTAQARYIIDSSKSVAWARLLSALPDLQVKVIHLERDLVQVANSWKKDMSLPEYPGGGVMMPKKSNLLILKTAFKIRLMMRSLKREVQLYYLNYEKLCANPNEQLGLLQNFLQVTLPDELSNRDAHAIGGNPMRAGHAELRINPASSSTELLTALEVFLFKGATRILRLV